MVVWDGYMLPRENFGKNDAIWCVLVYILIRLCRKTFLKINVFLYKI